VPSLITHLSNSAQLQLLDDLNYLNTDEIKTFCNKHSIPYSIWVETKEGGRRKSKDDDRKGVILDRIHHYLQTGEILPATCFPEGVVNFDDVPEDLKPTDRLFYGQYDKQSSSMVGLLQRLTDGQFKSGAIARILAREFWSKGMAPTFQEFAQAWLKAKENHKRPNPEWAFLSDRTDRKDTTDWKQLRTKKAKDVLKLLNAIGTE
jgi:hypothetical protein